MAVVTMRQLLESGVHFGHQTRRWNPKMKRFIMTERNGIYIIDLQQSLAYIDRSLRVHQGDRRQGRHVMFVGTKKQAQEAIAEQATRVGMPYVNQRWLGGMLTNFQTVHQRINRLKELDEIDFDDVAGSSRTKKELLQMRRERDKLNKSLGGIREMTRTPSAVWIVDTNKEHLAVEEARKLRIPIIGILDTNCDPDVVDFPIPGNDDAIRAVGLLTRVVADAVAEGLIARSGAKTDEGTEAVAPRSRWPSGSASCWAATPSRPPRPPTGRRGRADAEPAAEATGAAAEADRGRRSRLSPRSRPSRLPPRRRPPRSSEAAPRLPPRSRPPRPSPRPHPRPRRRRAAEPAADETTTPDPREKRDQHHHGDFTAADVKKLRELTGAGMMDCKKALDEADGDFDKAVELLRVKGEAKAAKRGAEREASAGLVAHAPGVLVELKSETDFVAKNDDFIAAAQQIADAASEAKPADVEALKAVAVGRQDRRRGRRRPRGHHRREDRARPVRRASTATVVAYMHKRAADLPPAVGVLVEYDGDADAARGAAMQIAAMRPQYLTRDEVPADVVERSARSPRRPRARRASPSRRSPRSPRAGSTASSRTSSCSSSRRSPRTRRRSRRSSTRPARR